MFTYVPRGIWSQPMKGIKTGIGRARAFLRLALMQKKLPDYLDLLQSSDQSFRATFWEDWSLIRNDEAPEIFGHMQGLSIGTVLNDFYSPPFRFKGEPYSQ